MTIDRLVGACLLGFDGADTAGAMQVSAGDSCPSLLFDRGRLEIFNPFRLSCDSGETVNLGAIIGCAVSAAYISGTEFNLIFEGRIGLRVSLREEDFIGAEAVRYQGDSGEVVTL